MNNVNSPLFVTGSEAGLRGERQIQIALETINHHGGIATTRQITQAVETALHEIDPNYFLSEQGKASLRFFVNKVAVNTGYVYKHDERGTGWRITPIGREYLAGIVPQVPHAARMLTSIGDDFQLALSDVYTLLNADKHLVFDIAGSAAFIRAGIILTVTAWETFIEDTVKARFMARINAATNATDVSNTFNAVAGAWIGKLGEKRPTPQDLLRWTGDGWKVLLTNHFTAEIATFNTPKSENVIALFKRYVGFDIKSVWRWHRMTPDDVCQQLDELVSIRGALVHRGRTSSEPVPPINRTQLLAMITLVEQLVWTTEAEINSH